MKKNKKIVYGVVGIIVLIAVFYGGVSYGKNQTTININGSTRQTFSQNGDGGSFRGIRNNGGGFTNGQIIAKDTNSITISLVGGGSKIIFLDKNTKIYKQAVGDTTDLINGTKISITGTANTDGSVSAQSIQIRPNLTGSMVK